MEPTSVADYCRAVEAHLTRTNGGHLVRIVGPGFELVRQWQADGVPLSVVQRAIEQKAERHKQGSAARTGRSLRIEFCAEDVQQLFEDWKRAVGVMSDAPVTADRAAGGTDGTAEQAREVAPDSQHKERRPSLSKHLERASERLARLLGRHDLSEEFLDVVNRVLGEVARARERAVRVRGPLRDEIAAELRPLDRVLVDAALASMTAADRERLEATADGELAAFRNRLDADAWQQAIRATRDRLTRERFALPIVDPDAV